MKLKLKLIYVFTLLNCLCLGAQQLPQFTQYMYNTISINPAYAGSRNVFSIIGLSRSQWVGLEGGPSTQTLSLHTPLKNEKIGLGLSLIRDQLGFENFNYVYGDFSYTIQTGINTKLAFGLKAGFTQYSLDSDFRERQLDDNVINGIEDRWTPNMGAGVFWHSDMWYLGFSTPRLLNTNYSRKTGFKALERLSYYATAGYVFPLSSNIMFKPSTLIKLTEGAPPSYDLTANFLFNEKLWLGAGYRINESAAAIGIMADYKVNNFFRVGYTYEHPNSDINRYTSGTHEVLFILEFGSNARQVVSPRYF